MARAIGPCFSLATNVSMSRTSNLEAAVMTGAAQLPGYQRLSHGLWRSAQDDGGLVHGE